MICLLTFLTSTMLFAQSDSTDYEYGIPVTEDDTVRNFPSADYAPAKNVRKIIPPELPKKVLRALTHDFQYRGWEKGNLYQDRNTGLYLVEIPRGEDIHLYGLNSNGKPVSVDVYRKPLE